MCLFEKENCEVIVKIRKVFVKINVGRGGKGSTSKSQNHCGKISSRYKEPADQLGHNKGDTEVSSLQEVQMQQSKKGLERECCTELMPVAEGHTGCYS